VSSHGIYINFIDISFPQDQTRPLPHALSRQQRRRMYIQGIGVKTEKFIFCKDSGTYRYEIIIRSGDHAPARRKTTSMKIIIPLMIVYMLSPHPAAPGTTAAIDTITIAECNKLPFAVAAEMGPQCSVADHLAPFAAYLRKKANPVLQWLRIFSNGTAH